MNCGYTPEPPPDDPGYIPDRFDVHDDETVWSQVRAEVFLTWKMTPTVGELAGFVRECARAGLSPDTVVEIVPAQPDTRMRGKLCAWRMISQEERLP